MEKGKRGNGKAIFYLKLSYHFPLSLFDRKSGTILIICHGRTQCMSKETCYVDIIRTVFPLVIHTYMHTMYMLQSQRDTFKKKFHSSTQKFETGHDDIMIENAAQ